MKTPLQSLLGESIPWHLQQAMEEVIAAKLGNSLHSTSQGRGEIFKWRQDNPLGINATSQTGIETL